MPSRAPTFITMGQEPGTQEPIQGSSRNQQDSAAPALEFPSGDQFATNKPDNKGKAPATESSAAAGPPPKRKRHHPRRFRKHQRAHSDSTVERTDTSKPARPSYARAYRPRKARQPDEDKDQEKGSPSKTPERMQLRRASSGSTIELRPRNEIVVDKAKIEPPKPQQKPQEVEEAPREPDSPQQAQDTSVQEPQQVEEPPREPDPPPHEKDTPTTAQSPQSEQPPSPVREAKWHPVLNRSTSDSASIPQVKPEITRRAKHLPLKPSLKQKSKSTTTTPPAEQVLDDDEPGPQKLRKMKTVDFEEKVANRLLQLPPLQLWAEDSKKDDPVESLQPKPDSPKQSPRRKRQTNLLRKAKSCLGPQTKCQPAAAAITRTDVHVVAIAPTTNLSDIEEQPKIALPTPTMQIVESSAGRYEVIWDDVADISPDHDLRSRRRSSSASQSLHAASSTCKGLERVSSKLSQWSFERDPPIIGPLGPFSPQVVVFPDEDSNLFPAVRRSSGDDDVLPIFTPPNTEVTTAAASAYSSRPDSERVSRLPSRGEDDSDSEEDTPLLLHQKTAPKPASDSIVLPKSDTFLMPGSRHGEGRIKGQPLLNRHLSNVEDSELHFRGHRDSVTLARDRILHAGGPSTEYIRGRDSVSMSMAKRRLKEKKSAPIGAQGMAYRDIDDTGRLLPIVDMMNIETPSTPMKQSAVRSLKNSASASMLTARTGQHRHIRLKN